MSELFCFRAATTFLWPGASFRSIGNLLLHSIFVWHICGFGDFGWTPGGGIVMNVTCRWISRGALLAAACFLVSAAGFSQQPDTDCDAGYQNFLANRNGPALDNYKLALTVGKDYVEKCGSLEGREETKNFVAKQLPKITEAVRITELVNRFNDAVSNEKWDDAFASGKLLIAANHPASLDILITFAGIGYTVASSAAPTYKYNVETIANASLVIQKLNSGATSDNYGVHQFRYKTKACSDGRANTISWMNYTVGYILYKRQKQVKDSLPYLIAASHFGCELKDYPEVYRFIGASYLDEVSKLGTARTDKLKASGEQETDETMAIMAMMKGYADRALDAYSRSYKFAKDHTDIPQSYKDAQNAKLKEILYSRFEDKHDDVDKFVAMVMTKPFPDPRSPVTPVVDAPPAVVPPAPPPKTPAKRP